MRVILVSMPWGALERPALGLSLLQARLLELGHSCEVRYVNMGFADAIGLPSYQWVTHGLPHTAFAGDWMFTEALYGADSARDEAYVERVLRAEWCIADGDIANLQRLRTAVEPFMAGLAASDVWDEAELIGFTSTFEQNIASLSLARRLKQRRPAVPIAFGGANWEGAMGEALHKTFPFVDYVLSGEADVSFPELVSALSDPHRKRRRLLAKVSSLAFREDGATRTTAPARPLEALDDLPIPRYDDYFSAKAASPTAREVPPVLLFEGSRGCWWGAKSHCTFCGLNGLGMKYRSKSSARMLRELRQLAEQWRCPTIEAVDNILDMGYFDEVLPALAAEQLGPPLFFEIKANLKRHHVELLHRAGVNRVQPGIESLSDHVLSLMRKGTTALRNIQLLKWCREYGIAVDWNLLYGFPGETDADYDATIELLPKLSHLQMPGACAPIRLDRFSPYFERSQDFKIVDVRPLDVYRYLYPPGAPVHDIAYYFQFSYGPGAGASPRGRTLAALVDELLQRDGGTLQALVRSDGGMQLFDTRPCAPSSGLMLSRFERVVIEAIDEVASCEQVMTHLRATFPADDFIPKNVLGFLDELVGRGIAVTDGLRYLSLVLMPPNVRATLGRPRQPASPRRGSLPVISPRAR